jgi:excisionase family DNA binding protein
VRRATAAACRAALGELTTADRARAGGAAAASGALRTIVREALEQYTPSAQPPEVLTRQTCAELLHVSMATLDRLVRLENLPAHRLGDHRRFRRSEVLQWLSARGTEPATVATVHGAIDQMRENLKRSASDLRELRERMEARLSQKCKELERLKLSIGSVLNGEDVED